MEEVVETFRVSGRKETEITFPDGCVSETDASFPYKQKDEVHSRREGRCGEKNYARGARESVLGAGVPN
ncbi:hypothetical protein E2C01_081931 [Portunus trituberculatus]|uniref:Uncharacterized protein n=1 Tax=Portunus trituberculatus TaxID=210409 RepID=A0A5B7INN3_PORTR|nr:hypothetical protein [Portunus trituberculatus]